VVIHYKPDDGPMMIVTRVPPGGVFGWSAAMGNPVYTSGADCAHGTATVRIRGSDLRMLCKKHPAVGKIILDRLAAVIAERTKTRKMDVIEMLEKSIRQQNDSQGDEKMTKPDPKTELQMKALVEQLSAYTETYHGGSVEYVSFDGKVLKVRLGGACLGCPLSPSTLHGWVEGTVRQFFPDIQSVEPV
jgi:Fe-S cluster biogenesis protein NfuA